MLGEPAPTDVFDNNTFDGSLLVTLSTRLPAGAGDPSDIEVESCRLRPIVSDAPPPNVSGAATVAVIARPSAGVANPAGTLKVICVVPLDDGSNADAAKFEGPL